MVEIHLRTGDRTGSEAAAEAELDLLDCHSLRKPEHIVHPLLRIHFSLYRHLMIHKLF